MSGDFVSETDPAYRFTGLKFYFNSFTKRGRFNYVAATYGAVIGFFLIKKLGGGKKEASASK
ncbi:hypothetical protein LSH36_91g06007 [Paralvinella palmiformis]|uniref:Up-regulated during skeletal muscle growth protein 5 n=1 Tax=Paralvinella palmiformis TaxID=53620 RepID=A0AAD9NAE7_9ANNE|nr:hypothetical protein LSH36_91g06007 [Paralvinella palmiformis]